MNFKRIVAAGLIGSMLVNGTVFAQEGESTVENNLGTEVEMKEESTEEEGAEPEENVVLEEDITEEEESTYEVSLLSEAGT